jgi:flagellar protein FliS
MEQMTYQQQATVGATGVELVVALYDGALRSLYRARQCVTEDDTIGRRVAVKKVVDILMYLEARLRPDVGGSPAVALSDFYAAMFTMVLEASHVASVEGFDEVIACIRNVRDAWAIVARDPEAGKVLPRELRTREEKFAAVIPARKEEAEPSAAMRWSA